MEPATASLTGTHEERRGARSGTVAERRAYVAARKQAARDRDAARYRLAGELIQASHTRIPPEDGFVVVPPKGVSCADDVVSATNDLIDSIGHDGLMARDTKGGFAARHFLPREELRLGSPYLRFALSEEVVGPVAAYFGLVPLLFHITTWYSAHQPLDSPQSSQLWHLDPIDTMQVKVWVHCSDVGPDSGPLTVLPARTSDRLAERIGYAMNSKNYRVPDDVVDSFATEDIIPLEGPTGAVSFVDTSSCFHFGSRVEEGGLPRRMAVFQYVTPYAFEISDERTEAPFRDLVSADLDELERLVLGAG